MARLTVSARRAFSASALSLAMVACGGDDNGPSGPQPASITIASGNFQSARYGSPIPSVPSVLVIGTSGPMAGYTVTFAVVGGGGSVEGASAVTDASGIARPGGWTLGPTPGTNTLRATAGPVSADITALATSGPPATVMIEAGDNQSWVERSTLPVRPSVKVTDGTYGVSGVRVTFAVASGNGTVAVPVVNTNSAGIATVGGWKLGDVGPNTLTATVNGIATPVTFTASAAALQVTAMNKVSGDAQQGFSGNYAPGRVTVEVLNQFSLPTEGVSVTFNGSGTVSGNVVTTGLDGRATLGGWRFGAGGSQSLTATAAAASATFTATTTAPAASQFNIIVRYLGTPPSSTVQAAFSTAAARWAQVIVGDLPNLVVTQPAGTLITGISGVGTITCVPALNNESVDDLVIYADVRSIDGEGAILGFATPWHVRATDFTTIAGCMVFDSADLDELASIGKLQDVIIHEMGHVIGIGNSVNGAPWGQQLVGECTSSTPYFTGSSARNAFLGSRSTAFTDSIVPVEGNGACPDGTRDSHWSESAMDNELMTGFVEYDRANPLSAVTAAAVRDLGYVVNDAVSDAYSLLRAPGGAVRAQGRKFRLNELEVRAPRIVLDHHGNEVRRIMR